MQSCQYDSTATNKNLVIAPDLSLNYFIWTQLGRNIKK